MDKKNNYEQGLFLSQLHLLLQVSFYYQLKNGEAIASTLILPSMRKSQIKLGKANSNRWSDDINSMD